MPYKNIVFIKLFLDLFDGDDRFLYQLTERQQLLYIKMLFLAGRQKNKISKNLLLIIQKINYQGYTAQDLKVLTQNSKTPTQDSKVPFRMLTQDMVDDLLKDIKAIKKVFPKFRETKHHYTFMNFEELHNRIDDNKIGSSEVSPKDTPRSIPKEKEKENKKEKGNTAVSIYDYYKNKIRPGAKADALRNIKRLLKEGRTKEDLIKRIDAYKQHLIKSNKTDPTFYIQANNFFGRAARYEEFEPQESKLKPADPNCKLCTNSPGFVFNESKSTMEVCRCRRK